MKDNKLLKVLWGIVLAIFLCSAIFIGISYFSGGDSSSSKKSSENSTTRTRTKNLHLTTKMTSLHLMIKLMSKNIEKVKTQTIALQTTLQITHLITMFLIVVQEKIEIITRIEAIDHQIGAQDTIAQIVIETLTHQDQVKIIMVQMLQHLQRQVHLKTLKMHTNMLTKKLIV